MASTSMIGHDVRLALPPPASEPALPLELIELELSLDGFATEQDGFSEAVRRAAKSLDGEFLFDLPASGLAEDCQRVAALRIPEANGNGMKIVFALLDADGTGIRVEDPSEATTGLKNFADSFVGVLERMQ
ncbi:hypothetical protein J2Y48_001397 [Mycoplana sp. BE70]|uniref:hypothetical protein n=1 Tax=Mycoplana sp. BE70 TaxID=2817775 RepID=UPI00285EC18F|nr:hypothetical protein [Mycoplana sp. BE70]MDR6756107.1 hypothetical protein [Mycoplana sp. BE70]